MIRYLRDQRGLEVLEWVMVGAAITAAVVVVLGPGGQVVTGLNDAAFKLRLLLVGLVP